MRFKDLYERWAAFSTSPRGALMVKLARVLFMAGVLGLLIYQLADVGWGEIWTSMPQQPLFYVILVMMYLLLPSSEAIIYSRLWGVGLGTSMPALFRKRVLNADVLGYSGEVYLYLWAKDRVRLTKKQIMAGIKDNLIVSSIASVGAAALLLGGLLLTGYLVPGDFMDNPSPVYVGGGVLVALLVGLVVARFRKVIFSLPPHTIRVLAGVHLSRFMLGYVLQVLQWWVVLPGASFKTWALLLAVFVLINRIPLLPSSDLVFVSAGAGLAPLLDVPIAPVVSMLLVRSALDRLLNLAFFAGTALTVRRKGRGTGLPESVAPGRDDVARDAEAVAEPALRS